MTTPTLEISDTARTEGTRRVLPVVVEKLAGLCRTCAKGPSCTLPRATGRPVLQCEEMEALDLPVRRTTGIPASERPPLAVAAPAALRGLCVNCERRLDCTFPRPAEGVWRCEEYV